MFHIDCDVNLFPVEGNYLLICIFIVDVKIISLILRLQYMSMLKYPELHHRGWEF
jgi:hypothetical protein